ncbi:MAG: tRNA-dependent cyclodipeptide synthase [Ketobacter sp.]|nr:MAG: tRNA-dependent cyclodipeptide synthase [Ketobacter sp.]
MDFILTSDTVQVLNIRDSVFYDSGAQNFGTRSLLIGMSPGNGYFTEENMMHIIGGLCECAPKAYIVIPDLPHVNNFLGMGYPKDIAQRKAKKDINQTKNRLYRAIARLHEKNITNFCLLHWTESIASEHIFQDTLTQVMQEYSLNKNFQHCINQVTQDYLLARSQGRTTLNMDVALGAIYYLEELALFASQARLFGEKLTVAYYKKWGEGLEFIADLFPEFSADFSMIQYNLTQEDSVRSTIMELESADA